MKGSACSPGSLQQWQSPELLSTALGQPTGAERALRGSKRKPLTVTITGDCCMQANPNGPKHPEMLGEGLPVKTAAFWKWQVRVSFSQGMVSQRMLVRRSFCCPDQSHAWARLPWTSCNMTQSCLQGLCSNLLCPPALVCLSAFHHNTTTKQRKYYHLHSLRNTDYHVAELCSYPVAATSLLSISQAAQLLCSALFFRSCIVFFLLSSPLQSSTWKSIICLLSCITNIKTKPFSFFPIR